MTFLAPALLALGLAVLVPLVLHLLQRHQGPRMVFPALRYLRRAEREHATRIRLRQLLLLALRVLALILLAAAAARPFLRGLGAGHPPSSVVLVLDNSLSTGAITGERRVLDALRDAALASLATAGPDDRFWLIRAGAPWEPAVSGPAGTVADAVRETEPSGARADLAGALERAASILAAEPQGRPREVQLLSDLQRSDFDRIPPAGEGESDGPVIVVYEAEDDAPPNRSVTAVEVGGGLPPRAGQRSTVAVTVASGTGRDGAPADPAAAPDSAVVRLVVDGSVRAAGVATGGAVALPFPARRAGVATGHAEIDPDALHADDRRYFAVRVDPPPAVALAEPQPFLDEAVAVLEDAGRVRRVEGGGADVVLAPGGRGADAIRRGAAVMVLPPASPVELAGTNQRLAAAGIPWRLRAPTAGVSRLDTAGLDLAPALAEVRLRQVYGLESADTRDSVALRAEGGEPWAVVGDLPGGGRYILLASPLTAQGGTIPTSAAMIPLLDRAISEWAATATPARTLEPGALIPVEGDRVAGPEGEVRVRPGSVYRPRRPGIYRVLRGDDTVAVHAVNPPPTESDLARLDEAGVRGRLPGRTVTLARGDDWGGAVFRARLGREITAWLVAAALVLLVVEMAVSASGRAAPARWDDETRHERAGPRGAGFRREGR